MKTLERSFTLKHFVALTALALLAGPVASAGTVTYTDFASMAVYNGTYVPGSPGHMTLAYSGDDDAVVGVRGPLGLLGDLSMTFAYSNPVGTGNSPFAAFGVSVDGQWGGSLYRYNIISMVGNQLSGSSLVHVWDWNLNGGAGGDVAGLGQTDSVTLDYVRTVHNGYNNVAFGDLEVMRAYAYIGDTGGPSSGSVDINSITVSTPDGGTTLALLGLALAGLVGLHRKLRV